MSSRLCQLAFLLCIGLAAAGGRAEPTPAQRDALDLAVIEHASGRHATAAKRFEVLRRQGVPAAAYNLAVMHLHRQLPGASPARARALLEESARGGFVTAQYMLAQALEDGLFGPRDRALAWRWYEVAAVSGSVEAQLALGTAHYLGRGRDKSPEQAASWYREAAKRGDIGAMYLLASMYEQGDGLAQDLRLARYWYAQAAAGGDIAAPGKLKEIDAKLAAQPG
jgi:TPR repeat protein